MYNQSPPKPSLPPEELLQEFHFESVKVNSQGEIVEKRISVANQYREDLGNGVILEME
jgi:hypothetical protein